MNLSIVFCLRYAFSKQNDFIKYRECFASILNNSLHTLLNKIQTFYTCTLYYNFCISYYSHIRGWLSSQPFPNEDTYACYTQNYSSDQVLTHYCKIAACL